MTDLEKLIEMLDSFGVFWHECQSDGTPVTTRIVLSEDYYDKECPLCEAKVEVPKNHKVRGYSFFYSYYVFDENGKFEYIGIYE